MKRAAAYARVSSDHQSETSIETQFEIIENFAQNGGLKVVKKYYDKITASGAKERPNFSEMISEALEKKFDVILVYKYDRFIRNDIEDQRIIRELESKGVFVISCMERIDTSTPAGRFQRWIISGLNRFYIENLQQEIYDKTTKVAQRGYFMGGTPPYGFSVTEIRDKEASRYRKIYSINENEAPIVRKIFEMYADGHSYAEIAEHLNKRGLRTRKGKLWTRATLFDMIRNEKYSGTFVFRKGNHNNGHMHRDDTIKVSGIIPRIVDEEVYEKVKERLVKTGRIRVTNFEKPLLRGIFYCGDCGSLMVPQGRKSNRYVCSRWQNSRDVPYMGISIDKADNFVIGYIKNTLLQNINFEEMAKSFNEEKALQDESFKKMIDKLEIQKKEYETKIKNAVDAIINGSPLADQLTDEASKMREELSKIEDRLRELKATGPVYITAEQIRQKYEEYRRKLDGDRNDKRDIILSLINRVTLFKGGYIHVEPK